MWIRILVFTLMRIRILASTLMRIRIQLPKMMRIRNTALNLSCIHYILHLLAIFCSLSFTYSSTELTCPLLHLLFSPISLPPFTFLPLTLYKIYSFFIYSVFVHSFSIYSSSPNSFLFPCIYPSSMLLSFPCKINCMDFLMWWFRFRFHCYQDNLNEKCSKNVGKKQFRIGSHLKIFKLLPPGIISSS